MTGLPGRGIGRLLEIETTVALDPVLPQVIAERHVDGAVRVEGARIPESIEGQHRLIDAALRIESGVGVGGIGPRRRHILRAGRDAVVILDLVVADRGPARDLVCPQIEHVERAELVEEEFRTPHQVFGAGLDREPRFRVIGIERAGPARSCQRHA